MNLSKTTSISSSISRSNLKIHISVSGLYSIMKQVLAFLLLTLFIVSVYAQPARRGGPGGAPSQLGYPIKSGPLPDMDAYTADGEPIKVREIIDGKYTVLSAGCLTCPQFHNGYPQVEAMAADYGPKGVQFFYFYKNYGFHI